jgi:xylan 1,4-beta-xylosidase
LKPRPDDFDHASTLAEADLTSTPSPPAVPGGSFRVLIRVDAARSLGELKPIWRFFGADEPNYAYLKHGRKLLGELGGLAPDQVFFRTHNLLNSGDGAPALK